jgi:hypothetical protein
MGDKHEHTGIWSLVVGACLWTAIAGTSLAQEGINSSVASISKQEAYEIGLEAYIYFYPLIVMDITRRQLTNVGPGKTSLRAPMNAFGHVRAYPVADVKQLGRPSFDTLYSSAWLDLTRGPVVVSLPNTSGRYYFMSMFDMWTDVFASPGKRTTGTQGADFAVVPAGWHGRLPSGVGRINAPTAFVWILGQTEATGPSDYDTVHRIQDGYKVTPIAWWQGRTLLPASAKSDPKVDMKTPALDQVSKLAAADYFRYAAELMKTNPPHVTDWSILARMKRLGIEVGKRFDTEKLGSSIKDGLARAAADGLRLMTLKASTVTRVVNGWQLNTHPTGVYGDDYLKRAIVAKVGLGANQAEDVIDLLNLSDAEGKPLDGASKYVLHIDRDAAPPTAAFWSITMYDQQGFQVENRLNRFALSSSMPLTYNPDGSIDIYFQADSPGADKEANWLPSPKGSFSLTLRLYAPKSAAITGEWNPPPIMKNPGQAAVRAP